MIKPIINLNDILFSTTYGEVFVTNIVISDGSNVNSTEGLLESNIDHITVSSHSINGKTFIYSLKGKEATTYNNLQTLFENKEKAFIYLFQNQNKESVILCDTLKHFSIDLYLLSLVLNKPIDTYEICFNNDSSILLATVVPNSIIYKTSDNKTYWFNIFELSYLMKKWAFERGFNIWSDYSGSGQIVFNKTGSDEDVTWHMEHADSEIEVIIKCCEFILKDLDGKV